MLTNHKQQKPGVLSGHWILELFTCFYLICNAMRIFVQYLSICSPFIPWCFLLPLFSAYESKGNHFGLDKAACF